MHNKLEQRKFVVPEVIVGEGSSLLIGRYLKLFGARKTLVVTDVGISSQPWFKGIINAIENEGVTYVIFDEVTSNPKDFEAMLGAELFLAEDCDSIVAVGGGSPMDCAKCISIVSTNGGHVLDYVGVDEIRLPGPPLLCIPTTAGTAADVSQFAIITDSQAHIKKAIISKKVVPDLALVDPVPLMSMDPYLTACTGMDALTHAIEAYVSNASSALTDVHALNAITLVSNALEAAVLSTRTLEVMHDMMMGSLHAGFAFSNASLGAVHALAHSLGGTLDLPHGECNSILLQRIIDLNFEHAKDRYRSIAAAMGVPVTYMADEDVKFYLIDYISRLRDSVQIPNWISSHGVTDAHIDTMSLAALDDPCMLTNPRALSYEEVRNVYVHLFKK